MIQLLAVSRPADRLGMHLLFAACCLLLVVTVVASGYVFTRRRVRRVAAAMSFMPAAPRPLPVALVRPMPGVALGTTAPAGWQDAGLRGVLGQRGGGELTVTCVGVDIAGLWIPRTLLRSIRVDQRFATKVMPGAGLLVVGWELSGRPYESGFRGAASGYEEVVKAVRGLIAAEVTDPTEARGVNA